jgi:hypothetical protein
MILNLTRFSIVDTDTVKASRDGSLSHTKTKIQNLQISYSNNAPKKAGSKKPKKENTGITKNKL